MQAHQSSAYAAWTQAFLTFENVILPSQPEPRLAAAQAEFAEIEAALQRVESAKDERTALATSLLSDARDKAQERVAFLADFRGAWRAAADAFVEAATAETQARRAVNLAEPDDVAAAKLVLDRAQANVRSKLRAGQRLIDRFRESAQPICPALKTATARTEKLAAVLREELSRTQEQETNAEMAALYLAAERAVVGVPLWGAVCQARHENAKHYLGKTREPSSHREQPTSR